MKETSEVETKKNNKYVYQNNSNNFYNQISTIDKSKELAWFKQQKYSNYGKNSKLNSYDSSQKQNKHYNKKTLDKSNYHDKQNLTQCEMQQATGNSNSNNQNYDNHNKGYQNKKKAKNTSKKQSRNMDLGQDHDKFVDFPSSEYSANYESEFLQQDVQVNDYYINNFDHQPQKNNQQFNTHQYQYNLNNQNKINQLNDHYSIINSDKLSHVEKDNDNNNLMNNQIYIPNGINQTNNSNAQTKDNLIQNIHLNGEYNSNLYTNISNISNGIKNNYQEDQSKSNQSNNNVETPEKSKKRKMSSATKTIMNLDDFESTGQQLMNRCSQAQLCVSKFKEEIEPNVTMHGSFKNGSFTMDSDIDLVAEVPITKIQNILSDTMSTQVLVNKSENRRMSRLILFDSFYGFQLDIVEFKDDLTRQTCFLKDRIVKDLLSFDTVVIQCVWQVKKWHRTHSKHLDTTMGFPNNYILTIVLFFLMMKRGLVPFINREFEFDMENFQKVHLSASEMLDDFFRQLTNPFNFEAVDLFNPSDWTEDGRNWLIVEPSTNTPFQTMRGDIPRRMASLAKSYFVDDNPHKPKIEKKASMNLSTKPGSEFAKMEKSNIECYEGKIKDVVDNLRKGVSVIKSFTDKNKKINVMKFINTSENSDKDSNSNNDC